MTTQPEHRLSFEEYLAFEARAEVKHEYDHGYLTAMAGATARHVTITQNVVALLRRHLRDTPCRVYSVDMKLRPSHDRGYYPDVFVTCDERDRAEELVKQHPSLIVEVLSDGTERRDCGDKWAGNRRSETLKDYVLISQYRQSVEVFSRAGDVWVYREFGEGDAVSLPGIDAVLTMTGIYEDVD
jgi:Uma2 family endonuclease